MSELLIRVVDKTSTNFYANCFLTKRGDVATVVDDNGPWGNIDRTNPEWRIAKLPNVTMSVAQMAMTPEPIRDPENPSNTRQSRMYSLNLDTMFADPEARAFLDDDTRQSPAYTLMINDDEFQALLIEKPPIPDPAIFGFSPLVF